MASTSTQRLLALRLLLPSRLYCKLIVSSRIRFTISITTKICATNLRSTSTYRQFRCNSMADLTPAELPETTSPVG
eukprot:scaffold7387_cov408-Prasinococcus_capsulatus_cf.AAC.16